MKNIVSDSIASEASGSRCRKAPPTSDPAESETKNKVIFESVSFLKAKNKTASQTHKVIEKQAINIFKKTIYFS